MCPEEGFAGFMTSIIMDYLGPELDDKGVDSIHRQDISRTIKDAIAGEDPNYQFSG